MKRGNRPAAWSRMPSKPSKYRQGEEAGPHQRVLGPAPVGDVEAAAGAEHAMGLGQGGALALTVEVMQQQ